MPDVDAPFDGLDAPRPLPTELRARLEAQLAPGPARALDPGLASRLTRELSDPVARAVSGLDVPRPLPAGLRAELLSTLASAPRRRRRPAWLATAVGLAAALVGALVLVLPTDGHERPQASPATPSTTPSEAAVAAGSGTAALGGAVPTPTLAAAVRPAPSPPAVATGSGSAVGAALPPPAANMPDDVAGVSLSPAAGRLSGGERTELRGLGVDRSDRVLFGDAVAGGLRVEGPNRISVLTPRSASVGAVRVLAHLTDGVTREGTFRYLPVPTLSSLAPRTGPAAGGTWVTLAGTGLADVTNVLFGGTPGTQVTRVSATSLKVRAPAHASGPVAVTASSAGGTSNALRYLYLP